MKTKKFIIVITFLFCIFNDLYSAEKEVVKDKYGKTVMVIETNNQNKKTYRDNKGNTIMTENKTGNNVKYIDNKGKTIAIKKIKNTK